jgi:hypothetical protein
MFIVAAPPARFALDCQFHPVLGLSALPNSTPLFEVACLKGTIVEAFKDI